jgi:EAL domain-containing protein (putative c-di-GMP-specific phosphodiesterase class I)
MSESLGIMTVAEGIEDPDQAARMRELGCTFGQGYWFSRPMPATDLAPADPERRLASDSSAGQRRARLVPGTAGGAIG